MPKVSTRYEGLGVGFAPYLQPPGPEVVRLTVGEPGFDTPREIVDMAISELDAGKTKYTRGQGSVELCQAVADYLAEHQDLEISADDVLITPGAKQALLYSFMISTMPGDEAILLAPAWASYEPMLQFIGAVPVHVSVKPDDYHPDIDAIRAAVTDKTTMILINSPCNPTGAVYTPEEIEALESKVTTKLQSMKELSETSQNIDDLLASKGELISVKDDDSELSASDAEIRGKLYELTGEEGVMPGDEVHVGMGLSDSSLAGNEIEETSSDFTFEDDDEPLMVREEEDQLQPARQKPKRRQSQKKTAECGACGAQIPVLAKECSVCGAEFE